jgi:hypothetical protein
VERRLIPINAVLDLALADGLNPSPLASAGWRVVCLEVPVRTELGTVVCDIVLFNDRTGNLLVVEGKSGANIEVAQAQKLARIDPQAVIIAGGITVPRPVPIHSEIAFACTTQYVARIAKGLAEAGLAMPILAADELGIWLAAGTPASTELADALGEKIAWKYPIARIIPFDHESPDAAFDMAVQAELVAGLARNRPSLTTRALTEQVVRHFALYGRNAQGRLVRKVTDAARRAAQQEPERLRFEPATGRTDTRLVVLRSPEEFDRRGRTQGYQATFGGRSRRRPAPQVPGQLDLFAELDQAERAAVDVTGQNDTNGGDDGQGR